jgi:hypothetical protein
MRTKLVLLWMLLLGLSAFAASTARALSLNIEVGDRPYYVHGAEYWDGRVHYVWVPGHWGPHHHVWIHGHYARR